MKQKINIVLFEEHPECNFYSLIINDDLECEMIKFSKSLINSGKEDELGKLSHLIEIVGKNGAEERYFRPAGKRNDNVWEFPDHYLIKSKYRLYCLKYKNVIVILGNGGLKTTRTYQEDPHLNSCVKSLQKVDQKIKQLEKSGGIKIENKIITGKLEFSI